MNKFELNNLVKLLSYLKKHEEVEQELGKQGRTGPDSLSEATRRRLAEAHGSPSTQDYVPPQGQTPERRIVDPSSEPTTTTDPSSDWERKPTTQAGGRSSGGGMHPGGGAYPSKPGSKPYQGVASKPSAAGSMHPGGGAYTSKQLISLSAPEKKKLVQLLDFLRGQ